MTHRSRLDCRRPAGSLLAPLLLVLVPALVAGGCTSPGESEKTSVLRLRLKEAPTGDPAITSVVVVVDHLAIEEKGQGWTELAIKPVTVDLLARTGGRSMVLAQQPIRPATYDRLRLGVSAAHAVR